MTPKKRFKIFLLAGLVAISSACFAQEQNQARNPRFVINLLDYVAGDYGGAVKNGKVISQSEYHEQEEFIGSALSTAQSLPEFKNAHEVLSKIQAVKQLIDKKAAADDVARQAQEAKSLIIQLTGMAVTPTSWPSLKRGRNLFVQNCATCHGMEGKGDGPAGANLTPHPANFQDPSMVELSPFKAFNVIRSGVPGTAMASFNGMTDREVWDLAFYVNSIRFHSEKSKISIEETPEQLKLASTQSDPQLLQALQGSPEERHATLLALRLHSNDKEDSTLALALLNLKNSGDEYQSGNIDGARTLALKAYLDGVEPAEPRLRANDPKFTSELEEKMAQVRSMIEQHKAVPVVAQSISVATESLHEAQGMLEQKASSPWVTFLIASGILLREGFEAVLILISLLAVIRASGSRKAAAYVHAGWVAAVGVGFAAWFLSGWLMKISGAQRELMEAVTSVVAVAVLLYMGFWLHSKTEIYRWKDFIDHQIKSAIAGGKLWTLAFISFTAVFREAFEVVLFLRAVWLEGGSDVKTAMSIGVFGSMIALLLASWALIKYSAKLPIRKVFSLSSLLMIALAVILAGKGIHSFQETGLMSVRSAGFSVHFSVLGIFPTLETLGAQVAVVLISIALWRIASMPTRRPSAKVAAAR